MSDEGKPVTTMEELEGVLDQAAAVIDTNTIKRAMVVIDTTEKVIEKVEQAEAIVEEAEQRQNVLMPSNFCATEMKIMAEYGDGLHLDKLKRAMRLHNELIDEGSLRLKVQEGEYDERLIRIALQAIDEDEQGLLDEEDEQTAEEFLTSLLAEAQNDLGNNGPDPTDGSDLPLPSVWHLSNPRKRIVAAKRNDPCPCGSGRKFKKCCWKTMPMYRDRLPKAKKGV